MIRSGKNIAFALAVGLLCLAALFSKRIIFWAKEEYYISCLESDNPDEVLIACNELADMKSATCVPWLIELIKADKRERSAIGLSSVGSSSGGEAESETFIVLTPIAYSVYSIGINALPVVSRHITIEETNDISKGGDIRMWSILCEIAVAIEADSKTQVRRIEYSETAVWPK